MKISKIMVLILFLSLFFIGSVSATVVTNDSQTLDDVTQIDKISADTNTLLKTENLNLNTQIDENQQDIDNNENIEVKEISTKLAASECDADDILSATTNQITVNSYSQLYSKIVSLKDQGTSKSYVINLNPSGDFKITKAIDWGKGKSPARDLTINGNGVTIDGKGSKAFLSIYKGYSVTINNVKFVNNYRSLGGGGAIFVDEGGQLNVNDCSFTGCKAISSSASENIHGGAIRGGYNAKIRIDHTIFKQNQATYGGGAIVIGATLSDLTTGGNQASMDPSTIEPTLIISNSQFIGNKAGHGGAINIEDYSAARITNCIFNGNEATDSKLGFGGGICTDAITNLISIDNTFQANTAKQSGGGIYNGPDSAVTINKSTFLKNQAPYGGAVCNLDNDKVTIADSKFTENKVTYVGGAIHNTKKVVASITNSTFNKNTATNGAGIGNVNNNKITVSDCIFNNNAVTKDGGAIYNGENNKVTVKNSQFKSNTANTNGGAIGINEKTVLTTRNSTFTSNKAVLGGAICVESNSNLIAENSKFVQNNASYGGAVYSNVDGNILIRDTELTGNRATAANGGAVTIRKNTQFTTDNVIFNKNKAKSLGGAICGEGGSNIVLANTEFNGNDATTGKAIFNPKDSTLVFKGKTSVLTSPDCVNNGVQKIVKTLKSKISLDSFDYSLELFIGGKLIDEYDSPIVNETVNVNLAGEIATANTDNEGKFVARYTDITPGNYSISATFNQTSVYISATKSVTEEIIKKELTTITAKDITTIYNNGDNLVVDLKNNQSKPVANAQIVVDFGSSTKSAVTDSNGQAKISTKGLSVNTYDAKISFSGNKHYIKSNTTAKITVNKDTTTITSTNVTTVYNGGKYLVVVLKDSRGGLVTNAEIVADFGSSTKRAVTDSNGQAKISTDGLSVKSYVAKIVFNDNKNYIGSSTESKVVVNKATPKFTAKAVTFKKSVKTKKYTVTLKTNKNVVMKYKWVTLQVNKKTYKIKTNSKGQAIFKITNLNKKGTFTAKVKYGGDKLYKSKTASPKITVK